MSSDVLKQVRIDLKAQYSSGKLKDSHIKKFLKNYYDGNPNTLKGVSKEDLLEDYIITHERLVGDDLVKHELNTLYERNGRKHCCGKELNKSLRVGYPFCEICGTEY